MRKAAINLSMASMTGMDFYMEMPVRDFIELYNEVVEEWRATKH